MGIWSVLSVGATPHTVLNNATNIGINYYVTFRLQYSKAGLRASLSNRPRWLGTKSFSTTIMPRRPAGNSAATCTPTNRTARQSPSGRRRYFRAYFHAHGQEAPFSNAKGHSKLFDLKGTPVTGATLGKPPPGNLRELPRSGAERHLRQAERGRAGIPEEERRSSRDRSA